MERLTGIESLKPIDIREWIRPYLSEEARQLVMNTWTGPHKLGEHENIANIKTDQIVKTPQGNLHFCWYRRTYEHDELYVHNSYCRVVEDEDCKDFAEHINNLVKIGWIQYGTVACVALELAQISPKRRTLLSLFTFSKYTLAQLKELTGQ